MGTTRIGETDDGTSVADPWSRVWGVDGLVVGGNGTIPTANTMNPTLTSVAVAVRGARKAAEHSRHPDPLPSARLRLRAERRQPPRFRRADAVSPASDAVAG